MHLKEIKAKSVVELVKMAEEAGIDNISKLDTSGLRFEILKDKLLKKEEVIVEGVLEILQDGFGFLRASDQNYLSGPNDVYVSPAQIKKSGLKKGDTVEGSVKIPKEKEKFFALSEVLTVNGDNIQKAKRRIKFENLTPLFPDEKLNLEYIEANSKTGKMNMTTRIIDIVSPQGKGQRSLIVAPPKTGKTVMLKEIAHAITQNHPEAYLMVLLIDERPEEVTDMKRSVNGEVVSSTFDEPAQRHVNVAEMVIEKAKRLVEYKKDVIILLDSITRLGRAYNTVIPSSGKVLTGGVDANALQRPKRFFGAARNVEEGGSLTIISTALVETGSRMDEVIFEEFKGTGNSEIVLDRKISNKRVYPAIDVIKSSTRKDDLLVDPSTMQKSWLLRKILNPMGPEAVEFLIDKMKKTKDNADFFENMNK